MDKIEIGCTVEKERWLEAAGNLGRLGNILAADMLKRNADGRGKEDADDLMSDIMLACTAMRYVGEFAVNKCRFIPVQGSKA